MSNYLKILKLVFLNFLLINVCLAQPSLVKVQGKQLIVAKRLSNGSLTTPQPYFIKGVCWSPASSTTINSRHVRIKEFSSWANTDIPLISAMNANTVYTFLDFGLAQQATKILDLLYQNNIMAIVTVDWDGTNNIQRVKEVIFEYKNHPAVLFWAIGNEWNINLHHYNSHTLKQAALNTEKTAQLIKSLDPNHPVASIFGEIIIPYQSTSTKEIIQTLCPSVDIWGLNIYRGSTFGEFFTQWSTLTDKPMFFSEFGTDSFYTEKWWPARGQEDLSMQANFVKSLWQEIKHESSAIDPNKQCLGGTVFEWVDEWWKVKPENHGNPSHQDPGGFPTPWNPYSHPDSFANEEHFGIVKIDRQKKPLYFMLKEEFGKYTNSK